MKRATKKLIMLVAGLVVIGSAIAAVSVTGARGSNKVDAGSVFTVARTPLTIGLTESGTIKSRDQHIVKSEVEGRTSVIYVIDEGVVVKKGELLVELDSSAFADRLVDQQIQVENTDANFVSAQENLEVAKIQSQSNIAKAELENQFAIEDKVKYIEGDWPKSLMQTQTDVTLAQEDFRRATDEFGWSKKLYAEKYLSETQYRADELALKRAELQVALAKENLSLLTQYTHTRKLAELDSNIEQKELALKRVNRESASNLVQAQARLRALEAEQNRQRIRLTKIEDQISKTKIHAPADGMVVYATSAQFSWRGDTEPLKEGQEVWERQELIHLPSADTMMVVIRVHESALGKIQLGQSVKITIDALPGSNYTGTVTKIAPLPDAASVWMNPDLKVYDTQIMIDGVDPSIRTGMSCKATILIADYDNTLAVPIQAVVGTDGKSVVYVLKDNKPEPRSVATGLDNSAMIHILSGLEEGERVLLTPPLGANTPADQAGSASEQGQETRARRPSGSKSDTRSGNRP